MTASALPFACCVHCPCGDSWRPGHSDACPFGCNQEDITVVDDHGVIVAQFDAYDEARRDLERARDLAVRLEGELHRKSEALRQLRALSLHRLPTPGENRYHHWAHCLACDKPWPCPTEVAFRQAQL